MSEAVTVMLCLLPTGSCKLSAQLSASFSQQIKIAWHEGIVTSAGAVITTLKKIEGS
jgi:hypothetical protein